MPADDAELNGEPDDATDDAADDAELNGEPDDPHDFAERLIDEAHVRLILQMSGYRGHASPIRALIRGYRWREGILSRGDVT